MKSIQLLIPMLAAFSVILACTALSQAQPPQGRGFRGMMGGGSILWLLQNEQIQKELDLVPEQLEQLQALAEKRRQRRRPDWSGFRDLTEEQRRERFAKMREEMQQRQAESTKEVEGVLLRHQVERLRQIQLQMQVQRGGTTGALSSDQVVQLLGITEEQLEKLREVRADVEKEMQEKMAEVREEARQKLLQVLTPEQRKKLEKALGEKFTLDRSAFRRGPQRGPGAGGGPQRGRRPEQGE